MGTRSVTKLRAEIASSHLTISLLIFATVLFQPLNVSSEGQQLDSALSSPATDQFSPPESIIDDIPDPEIVGRNTSSLASHYQLALLPSKLLGRPLQIQELQKLVKTLANDMDAISSSSATPKPLHADSLGSQLQKFAELNLQSPLIKLSDLTKDQLHAVSFAQNGGLSKLTPEIINSLAIVGLAEFAASLAMREGSSSTSPPEVGKSTTTERIRVEVERETLQGSNNIQKTEPPSQNHFLNQNQLPIQDQLQDQFQNQLPNQNQFQTQPSNQNQFQNQPQNQNQFQTQPPNHFQNQPPNQNQFQNHPPSQPQNHPPNQPLNKNQFQNQPLTQNQFQNQPLTQNQFQNQPPTQNSQIYKNYQPESTQPIIVPPSPNLQETFIFTPPQQQPVHRPIQSQPNIPTSIGSSPHFISPDDKWLPTNLNPGQQSLSQIQQYLLSLDQPKFKETPLSPNQTPIHVAEVDTTTTEIIPSTSSSATTEQPQSSTTTETKSKPFWIGLEEIEDNSLSSTGSPNPDQDEIETATSTSTPNNKYRRRPLKKSPANLQAEQLMLLLQQEENNLGGGQRSSQKQMYNEHITTLLMRKMITPQQAQYLQQLEQKKLEHKPLEIESLTFAPVQPLQQQPLASQQPLTTPQPLNNQQPLGPIFPPNFHNFDQPSFYQQLPYYPGQSFYPGFAPQAPQLTPQQLQQRYQQKLLNQQYYGRPRLPPNGDDIDDENDDTSEERDSSEEEEEDN